MTKVYARQVPPEFQSPTVFWDDESFPEDIAVFGNTHYKEHIPDVVKRVRKVLEQGDLAEIVEDFKNGTRNVLDYYNYDNVTQAINDYLWPVNREKYSTKDISKLKDYITRYGWLSEDDDILAGVLSIVAGEKWEHGVICGSCQGDWNDIFYPVDKWDDKRLERFEAEYWNMGSEWVIIDDYTFDPDTQDIDELDGGSFYAVGQNIDAIKKEIAEYIGCDPADVVLYAFEKWLKIPHYKVGE